MTLPGCSRWRLRQGGSLLCLVYLLALFLLSSILAIWYGVNSDRDYIHPLLTQLIPAGHCACESSTTFQCSSCLTCTSSSTPQPLLQHHPSSTPPPWTFAPARDARNEGLTSDQCTTSFPGLFEDIARASTYWATQGRLSSAELDAIPLAHGMARAFIHHGELHVVASRAKGEDHRRKILAVLSAMHRALIADPHRALRPDLEFVFSVEDKVEDVTGDENPVWVFSRAAAEQAVWLMPDFGFWAWDNPQNSIGPFDQVVRRIERGDVPWEEKRAQLVWRGKPSFAPKLRRALMDAARDKPWGDVKQVDWRDQGNFIPMEEHCRYMFIAHVEGRAYSASLKYRQACNSVIVAHKLQYIQHHHYLLVADGPNQNYVEVERDFSDLSEKMEPLLNDPSAAERIAGNSVRTFRERYLTKAAEACYWRMLFDGYRSVWNSSVPLWSEYYEQERGLRYESFVLLDSPSMFDFTAILGVY
ncbi:hypothetical protein FE257_003975 [Aspergillus nanangensis]|uniref:Glycosyl transferase CAP10 domain-containing protein n=1 Tax=Aspergillus nanangensis TaxID=2582783 RepID=A0AAD4GXF3_ASPNN|nr:hypothetical protein FE257_003975 [Aspergillus nanangensis]